jgi:hypothetical protein
MTLERHHFAHFSCLTARLLRRITVLAVAVAAVVAPASVALAAWTVSASGPAGGGAAAMPTGVQPTGSANGLSITISWGPALLPDATAVAGYTVARFDATTGQQVAVGGNCAGVVSAITCTERVGPGTWVYTDTPMQGNWTGPASPPSAPIQALG